MPLRGLALCLLSFLCFCPAEAKDAPPVQVLVWPTSGSPVVRFSFGKFKEVGVADKHHNYETEVTAENLWTKRISSADFTLYLYDKNKIRIADAALTISDVAPGSQVKFETYINATGPIVSLELIPKTLPAELEAYLHLPPKLISVTVNSVPQGADFKVDGAESGTTPKIIQIPAGKHVLSFHKEGFSSGTFPLELAPDAVSGGSISYELGNSTHDSVELRDGSVLSGDVESVSATEVILSVGGAIQHLNRNSVKRIVLIQREAPSS
jgi:PEGA domain